MFQTGLPVSERDQDHVPGSGLAAGEGCAAELYCTILYYTVLYCTGAGGAAEHHQPRLQHLLLLGGAHGRTHLVMGLTSGAVNQGFNSTKSEKYANVSKIYFS